MINNYRPGIIQERVRQLRYITRERVEINSTVRVECEAFDVECEAFLTIFQSCKFSKRTGSAAQEVGRFVTE